MYGLAEIKKLNDAACEKAKISLRNILKEINKVKIIENKKEGRGK